MKHDEIKKQIRDASRDVPIPDALKPDQIKERLPENRKGCRVGSVRRTAAFGGLAAAALLLFITSGILLPGPANRNHQMAAEMAAADGQYDESADRIAAGNEGKEGMRNPSSYDDLYQLLLNYEKEQRYQDGAGIMDDMVYETAAAVSEADTGETSYSDTNVQVQGVDEGDIVKTDGQYIYMLNQGKGCLQILAADGENLTLLSEIQPPANTAGVNQNRNRSGAAVMDIAIADADGFTELYLQDDLLVLIRNSWQLLPQAYAEDSDYFSYHYSKNHTEAFIYDISDKRAPKLLNSLSQDGSYQSSRLADGFLYLFSYHRAYLKDGAEDLRLYVPAVLDAPIPVSCIYLPEEVNTTGYLVITAIDLKKPTPDFSDRLTALADAADYYVSNENIYVTSYSYQDDATEIMKFSYSGGKVTPAAGGKVKGWLNNSFSLDEYGGFLRVVATGYEENTESSPFSFRSSDNTVNQLIILNDRLDIVSTIADIAPGELIQSARFMGSMAYFVTFRQIDPLFCADLSDPYEPKILGELKITGFSSYLHPYGDSLLLGIGFEADENTGRTEGIKLSMFDISNPADIREIHKLILPDGQYSPALYNHKAVLISPQENIIGFMVDGAVQSQGRYDWFIEYRTFSYQPDSGFSEDIIHSLTTDQYYYTEARGLYIGDYLYIIGEENHIYIYNRMTNEYLNKWENLQ